MAKKYPRIGVGGYAKTVWSWVNRNTTSIEKLYLNEKNITSFTFQILCKYFSDTFQQPQQHI